MRHLYALSQRSDSLSFAHSRGRHHQGFASTQCCPAVPSHEPDPLSSRVSIILPSLSPDDALSVCSGNKRRLKCIHAPKGNMFLCGVSW